MKWKWLWCFNVGIFLHTSLKNCSVKRAMLGLNKWNENNITCKNGWNSVLAKYSHDLIFAIFTRPLLCMVIMTVVPSLHCICVSIFLSVHYSTNADLPMARMMNSCHLIHKWVLVMVRKIRVMLLPVLQPKQLQQVWRRSMETCHSMQATHVSWHPQLLRRLLLYQRAKVGLICISSLQQVPQRNVVRTLHPKNSKMVQHHDNEKLCMNVQILSCVVAVASWGLCYILKPLICNNYFFQKGLCFDIHYMTIWAKVNVKVPCSHL